MLLSWLPPVPTTAPQRFDDTRIETFRGFAGACCTRTGTIHHLYPSVPWRRYRAVFHEVRPPLESDGTRLELATRPATPSPRGGSRRGPELARRAAGVAWALARLPLTGIH